MKKKELKQKPQSLSIPSQPTSYRANDLVSVLELPTSLSRLAARIYFYL